MAWTRAPLEEHLAAGYGSDDDDPAPRRAIHARGFGALPGDAPGPPRISGAATAEYGVRQNSSGPGRTKVRYIENLWSVNRSRRLAPSQTKPRTPFERHCELLRALPTHGAVKSDLQLLRESHRFLRGPEDDDGSWEARLAQRYYARLFREYVICDLAGYKHGNIGLRWRTEAEVRSGKGQFSCGHKSCSSRSSLRSFEVDFKYHEAGMKKRALVKARLCEDCAYKLHYRRLRAARRRGRCERGDSGEPPEAGAEAAGPAVRRGVKRASTEVSNDAGAADAAPAKTGGDPASTGVQGGGAAADSAEERRLLEALAWSGPDPEARAREDDFDDYLHDLFM